MQKRESHCARFFALAVGEELRSYGGMRFRIVRRLLQSTQRMVIDAFPRISAHTHCTERSGHSFDTSTSVRHTDETPIDPFTCKIPLYRKAFVQVIGVQQFLSKIWNTNARRRLVIGSFTCERTNVQSEAHGSMNGQSNDGGFDFESGFKRTIDQATVFCFWVPAAPTSPS